MSIDLLPLRIASLYPNIANQINDAHQSFAWKSHMLNYHKNEALRNLDGLKLLSDDGNQAIEMLRIIYSEPGFLEKKMVAEANLIAAAQALHSMFDICGKFTYYGLRFDKSNPLSDYEISFANVRKLVTGDTLSSMNAVHADSDYIYLNAFVNVTKHRSLVKTKINVYPISNMQFEAFDYKDRFPARSVIDFIAAFPKIYRLQLRIFATVQDYYDAYHPVTRTADGVQFP